MKNFYLTLIISIVTVINPILCAKAEGVTYSALPLDVAFDASCTTVLSDDTESINHSALPLGAPVDESCTNWNKGEATFGIEIISEASEVETGTESESETETETETEKFSIETIGNEHINTTTIDKNKKPSTKKHKIGLALSGGGALGFAHIGAIPALE